MNQTKIILLLLFLLPTSKSFQAQDTILSSKIWVSGVISYDPAHAQQNEANNAIIREIAEDAVKRLRNTHLVVRANLSSFLLRKGDLLYFRVLMDSCQLEGDHFYRKLSFSDVIKPSLVRFDLQLRSVQDSLIIDEYKDLSLHLRMNDSTLLPIRDGSSYKASAWIQTDNASFCFDQQDLAAFHQRQRLIDDYYASAAIADSLESVTRSMDLKTTAFYPEYFIRIEEIGKIEQLIRARSFEKELSLANYDPRGLSVKCYHLLRFARSSAMTFESALDTIPVLNSRLSEDSLIISYLDLVKRYIRWSFLVNERNSGIYREFLDRFFEMQAFEDDEKALIKLIGKVYPVINADSIFTALLVNLKKAYQNEARMSTLQSRYAEAIGLLDHLRRLEDKYPFLKDTLADQDARQKAAYGIYSSYIGVAENSLNVGNDNIAK